MILKIEKSEARFFTPRLLGYNYENSYYTAVLYDIHFLKMFQQKMSKGRFFYQMYNYFFYKLVKKLEDF